MESVEIILGLSNPGLTLPLPVGEIFDVTFTANDIRTSGAEPIVFSLYTDINFDPTILRATGISYNDDPNAFGFYSDAQTGEINNNAGIINEVGATSSLSTPSPNASPIVFTVTFEVLRSEPFTITTDAGDEPSSQIVLYGESEDQSANTQFGAFSVEGAVTLADQFQDVTASSFPRLQKESDIRVWQEWEDTDGDGLVDKRPSYSVAWGDFNGDGYVDLWLSNHFGDRDGPPPSLFINQQDGTFENRLDLISSNSNGVVRGDRHGSVWADFDNDGDQDLIQLVGLNANSRDSRNKLLINEDGILVDKAGELGILYGEARAREATVFDFNNDGLLDFIHGALTDGVKDPELPPTVFQQNADGTFSDIGAAVNFEFNQSYGLEYAAIADFDGDGRLEVFQKQPNDVYDISTGVFTNVSSTLFDTVNIQSQTELDRGLVDLAIADFNGDLIPDLFLPTSAGNRRHRLILSSPTGWEDKSIESGVRSVSYRTTDGGGVGIGDFDNDMDLDIFVLNQTIGETDFILENQGDGTFTALPFPGSTPLSVVPRSDLRTTAIADYNNDGFLDILETTNRNAPTNRLFQNTGNSNHWILIDLEGTDSNRDGIGATVYVTAGGVTQVRQQTQGQHHRAQDDRRLHFGLGEQNAISEIRIQWPSGTVQVLSDIIANQVLQIVESDGINNVPVANDDTATTGENTAVQIQVLNNDTDPDGDLLSISSVGTASNGSVALGNDDNIQYTPNEGFSGSDSFTYTISDGELSDTATVTVTVSDNDAPVANVDNIVGEENTLIAGNVLDNDTDANSDDLTATLENSPSNGSVTLAEDGSFEYTPNVGFIGTDSFTYTVSDGALTDVGTVNITVNEFTPPGTITGDDNNNRLEGTPGDDFISAKGGDDKLLGLAGNDELSGDAGNDRLLGGDGEDNLLGGDGNDTLLGGAGDDRLMGGQGKDRLEGGSDNDTLFGDIGDDRLLGNEGNDLLQGGDGSDILIGGSGQDTFVLAVGEGIDNINDFEQGVDLIGLADGLTFNAITLVQQGSDSLIRVGAETLAKVIGITTLSEVDFTVLPDADNNAPVATVDNVSGDENTLITGNVLDNDTDIDGDSLTTILASEPTNGAVILAEDGSFEYTPEADFTGSDSFTYTVSDGELTDVGTVNITVNAVNNSPIAGNDATSTDVNTAVNINVISNDSDIDGDSLSITEVSTPANGSAVVSSAGVVTYTPNSGFIGSDSFTYTITDGELSDTGTVDIIVRAVVNDAPIATADNVSGDEDTLMTGNVLDNDTDINGDSLTTTIESSPTNGSVTLTEDGDFEYTPDANFTGNDSFFYVVSDGELTDIGTVNITVNAVNDSPIAVDDTASTDEEIAVDIDVIVNDSDVDGDALLISDVGSPDNGSAVISGAGIVTYTPNPSFTGSDSFTYTVSDGELSDVGTVNVTVNAVTPPNAVVGDENDNRIEGTSGNDLILARAGDDKLLGLGGDDELFGEDGKDRLLGGPGNDSLFGGDDNDILLGGSGDDRLLGNDGNDRLIGADGDDELLGNIGNDRLFGEAGDDLLRGGDGDDILIGGQGGDTFVLVAGEGTDNIVDFEQGLDLIGLTGGLTFEAVNIVQQGSNALILVGDETLATVSGVTALTEVDFTTV